MPLIFNGNLASGVYSQNFSNNQVNLASANENANQAQAAARRAANQQIQSQANAGMEGQLQSNHSSNGIVGLHTDVCDFNIIPRRDGNITADGALQTAAAGQVSAQGPGINTLQQLENTRMTAVPNVNISSPPNDFPVNSTPFAVNITGNGAVQNNDAKQVLEQIQAKLKKKGLSQAQLKASLASQSQVRNDYSLAQDGTVTYNPTGPIDPVTNTAPGTADFLVFSSITNNQAAQFSSGGNTSAQVQTNRPGGIQTGNNLALAKQGGINGSGHSFISIA